MDHIEVVRGPQGDLYGRNATGGSINVITRKASEDASLDATLTDYKLTRASLDDVRTEFASPDQQVPPVDLVTKRLAGLRQMRAKDSVRYGSKAANQGEMLHARVPGVIIPDGFSVPFHWYDQFMKRHKFDERIAEYMENLEFVHNPRVRRQKLEQFRNDIQKAEFDKSLRAEVIRRWRTQLRSRPVFVRATLRSLQRP